MNITSSWIKDHLGRTILSDKDIVEAIERSGIEVEQANESPDLDASIIVGLVKKVIQHPNANRLRIAKVVVPAAELNIVCGAPNLRVGLKVAVAQIGSILPSGDRIEKAKLRGEFSEGMLCSQKELGIGNNHDGIIELSNEIDIGIKLAELYPADTLIDLKTPANRFDLQSVYGIAREVAGMTGSKLVPIQPQSRAASLTGKLVKAHPEAERYTLARLKVDSRSQTPSWILRRLASAGIRGISPVVDVTNYVMLDIGQPLHAFDVATVKLPIEVRYARPDEVLVTLDGVERKLSASDLIIADQEGPIALAGLMGGKRTEVTESTSEILLEAAVFNGATVRKMAKRHTMRTEASARFERDLPSELPILAADYAIEMLEKVASAQFIGTFDVLRRPSQSREVDLDVTWLSRFLGTNVSLTEAKKMLDRLQIPSSQLAVHDENKEDRSHTIRAEIPWWRPDLKLPEDLAEEVAKILGYENIPSTFPEWRPAQLVLDEKRAKTRALQLVLFGAGLFEVMTYSFVSADRLLKLGHELETHLKLKNPLSSDQAYLRSSLLASHMAVLERNRAYGGASGFYELSHVFIKRSGDLQPNEPEYLGVTLQRESDSYFGAKGILDAIANEFNIKLIVRPQNRTAYATGRCADVWLGDANIGTIGQIHPGILADLKISGEVTFFELDAGRIFAAARPKQFTSPERYPSISRDLSILVSGNVTWQQVADVTKGYDVTYVEQYYGSELPAGLKSMTVRVTLTRDDRTPTESEANLLEAEVMNVLAEKVGAEVRT